MRRKDSTPDAPDAPAADAKPVPEAMDVDADAAPPPKATSAPDDVVMS